MNLTKLFVCVLLTYLVDRSTCFTCPSGAVVSGNYCFIASKQATDFSKAYLYCEAYGCSLAIPRDATMRSALSTFASANDISANNVLFGCSDAILEDTWMCYGAEQLTDITWAGGEPNGGTNDNCLTATDLTSWTMADTSCGGNKKFICECDTIA